MTRKVTSLPFTELEVATGNYDESRTPIDRIVLHTMDGAWQGAAARFDNPLSKVSAHYGVKLDGSYIHWLEETFTAYANGNYPMNQRAISIEHEDGGDYNGVRPDALYAASAKLVRDICLFYNIPVDRTHILKHSEVSDNPTACPDALDVDRIVREAQATANEQALIDDLRLARDKNWNLYNAEITKNADLSNQVTELTKKVGDVSDANRKLIQEVTDITDKCSVLASELSTIHEKDSEALSQGQTAVTALKNQNLELWDLATAIGSHSDIPSIKGYVLNLEAQLRAKEAEKQKQGQLFQGVFDLLIKVFGKKKI